jgi:hypothetical protein
MTGMADIFVGDRVGTTLTTCVGARRVGVVVGPTFVRPAGEHDDKRRKESR